MGDRRVTPRPVGRRSGGWPGSRGRRTCSWARHQSGQSQFTVWRRPFRPEAKATVWTACQSTRPGCCWGPSVPSAPAGSPPSLAASVVPVWHRSWKWMPGSSRWTPWPRLCRHPARPGQLAVPAAGHRRLISRQDAAGITALDLRPAPHRRDGMRRRGASLRRRAGQHRSRHGDKGGYQRRRSQHVREHRVGAAIFLTHCGGCDGEQHTARGAGAGGRS